MKNWLNSKYYKLPVDYTKLSAYERIAVRKQYVELQNNRCFWCGNALDAEPTSSVMNKTIQLALFPPNFLKHPIHLQHNHNTGMTEGAVHARCNAVMWQYYGR